VIAFVFRNFFIFVILTLQVWWFDFSFWFWFPFITLGFFSRQWSMAMLTTRSRLLILHT